MVELSPCILLPDTSTLDPFHFQHFRNQLCWLLEPFHLQPLLNQLCLLLEPFHLQPLRNHLVLIVGTASFGGT